MDSRKEQKHRKSQGAQPWSEPRQLFHQGSRSGGHDGGDAEQKQQLQCGQQSPQCGSFPPKYELVRRLSGVCKGQL